MTRTERNQNPAALLRDRHSRSGLLKSTEQLRKNGAGAHNWGSFRQEGEAELAADADAMFEMEGDDAPLAPLPSHAPEGEIAGMAVVGLEGDKEGIARSPSESMSSVESDAGVNGNGSGHGVTNGGAKPVIGRRMSNVSEEERERARVYREGVMTKGKGDVDLAHIARTSYGIAQSPPNGNEFSTSPVKAKGSFMQTK